MIVQRLKVAALGGKLPRIAINSNDPDYQQKLDDPKNWDPAVLCELPEGGVTPVAIDPERAASIKVGDVLDVYSELDLSPPWQDK